jgi:hypothetical protein
VLEKFLVLSWRCGIAHRNQGREAAFSGQIFGRVGRRSSVREGGKIMTAKMFAWVLAGALMVPQAASANDATLAPAAGSAKAGSLNALPLPPIPHLDTIPWLAGGGAQARQEVDILLGPKFETVQFTFDHSVAKRSLPSPSLQSRDASMRSQ